MTGLGLLALGAGAAAFVVARSFQEDADRSDPSISLLLKQTPWAPPDAVSRIARLERLSTHPSLDDAEAGFLLESLARAVPDVDASQRDVPISESPQAQAWFLANHEVIVARGIAVKALRDGWPIPDRARDSIEHILLSLLDSDDRADRLAGTTLVVNSRMIESSAIRARIEALRLWDKDPAVRANAEKQLAYYAYLYEGGAAIEKPTGCNTCP